MTYQEFKDKYNGQWIDWDGAYGCQCWDLAQKYCTEALGLPSWVLSGCGVAKNLLIQPKKNDLDTYFDEISVREMIPGDLCIWWNDNTAGHIALFDRWDDAGNCNYYFSQNPGASKVQRCEGIGTLHAFRLRKKEEPVKKEITPNVERDEYKDQIEVIVDNLRVRVAPNTNAEVLGKAKEGFYNYYETYRKDENDYVWYKIADNQWVASNDEWTKVYPKKKEEFKQFKVLDKKDGYVLVDLGKVWVAE